MGSIQNKDLEKSSQRLRTACIMKTTVAQSALHGLPCEETKKTNTTKTRRNINRVGRIWIYRSTIEMRWQSALKFAILLMMVHQELDSMASVSRVIRRRNWK